MEMRVVSLQRMFCSMQKKFFHFGCRGDTQYNKKPVITPMKKTTFL